MVLEQLRLGVAFEQGLNVGSLWMPTESFSSGPSVSASRIIQLAASWNSTENEVRNRRKELGVKAVFNRVDTCSAEFESFTPYLYSTYETACLRSRAFHQEESHDSR